MVNVPSPVPRASNGSRKRQPSDATATFSCAGKMSATQPIQPTLGAEMDPHQTDRLTLYGSFTSSSSYKPMLYLALARLPFSFRTVNLKTGVQKTSEYLTLNRWGVVPSLRHRGLTILQSNVILDYLARETGHFEGATEQEGWQAREWLSWEADHITAVAKVRHSARFRASHPEVIAEFRPKAEAALSFVDETLKDRDWLV